MSRDERAQSFGANAGSYERARPGYPAEAARWLVPERPGLVVELGAGTGKLTRALAGLGVPVLAVEPDDRMRAVLESLDLPGVEAVQGTAESIPVGDGAAGVVVSGSAFHWFDLDRVLPEAARALGPGGLLSFAWNRRDERDPLVARIGELIHPRQGARARIGTRLGGNRPGFDRPWAELLAESGLFEPVEKATFEHAIELSRGELGDLARSYSRVGLLPAEEQEALVAKVRAAAEGERVRLPFVVHAFRAAATG